MAGHFYQDLVCPECDGVLWEVREKGVRMWLCLSAIGEQVHSEQWQGPVIPQPSKHLVVTYWKVTDGPISRQLFDMGPFADWMGKERKAG